jgi:hypothetical protein
VVSGAIASVSQRRGFDKPKMSRTTGFAIFDPRHRLASDTEAAADFESPPLLVIT